MYQHQVIVTDRQEERDSLHGYISDASKDAWGFRTRIPASTMTIEELKAEADYWSEQVGHAIREERERQEAAVIAFEETIEKMVTMGAGDRATALRWLRESEDDPQMREDDAMRYTHDLPWNYNLETGERMVFEPIRCEPRCPLIH